MGTMPASPPNPHACFDVAAHDGAVIRVRRHGRPDGPRLEQPRKAIEAIERFVAGV